MPISADCAILARALDSTYELFGGQSAGATLLPHNDRRHSATINKRTTSINLLVSIHTICVFMFVLACVYVNYAY